MDVQEKEISLTATCATAKHCLSQALESTQTGLVPASFPRALPGPPQTSVGHGWRWSAATGAFLEMPGGWYEAVALAGALTSGLFETTVKFGNGVQSHFLPCRFQGRSPSLAMDLNPSLVLSKHRLTFGSPAFQGWVLLTKQEAFVGVKFSTILFLKLLFFTLTTVLLLVLGANVRTFLPYFGFETSRSK